MLRARCRSPRSEEPWHRPRPGQPPLSAAARWIGSGFGCLVGCVFFPISQPQTRVRLELRGLSAQRAVISARGIPSARRSCSPSYVTSRPAGTSAAGPGTRLRGETGGRQGRKHVPAAAGHRAPGSQVAPCPSFPPPFPAEGPPDAPGHTPALQGGARRPEAHAHTCVKCPAQTRHLSPGRTLFPRKKQRFVAGTLCSEVPPSHSGTPRGLGSSQAPREHEGQHSCQPGRPGEDSVQGSAALQTSRGPGGRRGRDSPPGKQLAEGTSWVSPQRHPP